MSLSEQAARTGFALAPNTYVHKPQRARLNVALEVHA